jgi:hypothetical protein
MKPRMCFANEICATENWVFIVLLQNSQEPGTNHDSNAVLLELLEKHALISK